MYELQHSFSSATLQFPLHTPNFNAHIAGYFQGGNISQMHCGTTFHEKDFHEWVDPHSYEALNKSLFTGKLLTH